MIMCLYNIYNDIPKPVCGWAQEENTHIYKNKTKQNKKQPAMAFWYWDCSFPSFKILFSFTIIMLWRTSCNYYGKCWKKLDSIYNWFNSTKVLIEILILTKMLFFSSYHLDIGCRIWIFYGIVLLELIFRVIDIRENFLFFLNFFFFF